MQYKNLDALQIKKMILAGSQNLAANKEIVDALNVFPVPDGDTGTNMSLTILAAADEVEKQDNPTMKSLAQAMTTGALMGARGNSGVILSQLFRGFAQVLEGSELVDAKILAKAFQNAADVAYKAVIKPVEGTILTVAKAAARGAKEAAQREEDCLQVLSVALSYAQRALEKTPEMLPALAQAGVVDAGGKGLCIIIEGAINGLIDEKLIPSYLAGDTMTSAKTKTYLEAEEEPEALEYRYCTEFLIKGAGLSQELIRRALEPLGDSLLVVGTDTVTKVHIHTNQPGKVLDYAVGLGTLHDIKIDNMEEQREKKKETAPLKDLGIVAVAVGEGLSEILKSLGCDVIVSGGQTMNPSTLDLVDGIKKANAKEVFILPNNKNIILTAEQTKELLEDINVTVLPTKTFPQGMAALLAFNPEADVEENRTKMLEAINNVKSGEITYAVRDSQYNGFEIRQGEILGILEGQIVNKGEKLLDVGLELVQEMLKEEGELLTLFYGSEVEAQEAEAFGEEISKRYPDLDVEIHFGGQPLYYYIIALE